MRTVGPLLLTVLLAVSCGGDDASGATESSPPPSSVPRSGTVAGPTTVPAECLVLADEYVVAATELFTAAPPTDALVEQSRVRFEELDARAGAGRCGDTYREAVCDGLDELTRSGTLVIYPMVTAQCI